MIRLEHVSKTFTDGDHTVDAVKDVSLEIRDGEIFGIIGFSGAGKSTLVRCINFLGRPTAGKVWIGDRELGQLSAKELRQSRKKIGMIFQHFNLMKSRTIYGNVAFPLKGSGLSRQQKDEKVRHLLELVGIADKADAYPGQLSGGQQQRAAIARALANDPDILLCDEATSALDPQTTRSILKLLKELNQTLGLTEVIITHQMSVVKEICDRVAVMEQGKVVEQGDVFDVFSNPKEEITRNFVNTTSNLSTIDELIASDDALADIGPGELIARFTFTEKNTSQPLISTMTSRFQVTSNIIFADIEYVHGSPIGGTVAILSGTSENIERAFRYLRSENVGVEVLKDARTADKIYA